MINLWFAVVVLTLGVVALTYAIMSLWVEVKAMQKSTHTIQYVNPLAKFEDVGEDVKSTLHKDPFEPIM